MAMMERERRENQERMERNRCEDHERLMESYRRCSSRP
jgi:hypothetical protein